MKHLLHALAFSFLGLIFAAGCGPKDEKPSGTVAPIETPKGGADGSVKMVPGEKIPADPRKKK
jgi:hypothetical protein